jgi:MFS family permease
MAAPHSSNGAVEQPQHHHDEATETSPLLGNGSGNSSSKNQQHGHANGHANDNADGSGTSPHETDDAIPEFLITSSPTRFWLVFWTLCINVFIASFDGTIMASSHPVITSYFHAANSASWLSTVYLLSSTAFQPILGRLSDATGRKPLFVICSIIFFIATVWCALAGSIESFIAARTLCGLGAGGAMSLGGIITSDIVPIQRRGSYQAIINIVVGVGAALGAALGGAMAESLGWRWEFGVQLPFLAFCTLVSILSIPADLGRQDDYKGSIWASLQDFDATGSLLLTVMITFLILGLNLGGNVLPWSHPLVIASLVVFSILAPLLIWVECRAKKPVMPLNILSTTPRANLVFSNFLAAVVTNALLFNM